MNTQINGHRVITNEEGITEVVANRMDSMRHVHATLYALYALDIDEVKVSVKGSSYIMRKSQCEGYLRYEKVYKSMYDAISVGAVLEEWAVENNIDLATLECVADVGLDWEWNYMQGKMKYKVQQYTECLKAQGVNWSRRREYRTSHMRNL